MYIPLSPANQQHQRHAGVGPGRVWAPGVHVGPGDGDRQPPPQLPGHLPEQLGPQTLHLRRAAHLLKEEGRGAQREKGGGGVDEEKENEAVKQKWLTKVNQSL